MVRSLFFWERNVLMLGQDIRMRNYRLFKDSNFCSPSGAKHKTRYPCMGSTKVISNVSKQTIILLLEENDEVIERLARRRSVRRYIGLK